MQFTMYRAVGKGNEASNSYYPVRMTVRNETDFLAMIAYDHVCSEFRHNRRSNEGFVSADCLVMDNDNDHSDDPKDWIRAKDYEAYFPNVSYVVVPSRHNGKPKGGKTARPRQHIYFPITPVTDGESYAALKQRILKRCPFLDKNCADAARFIFGCQTGHILWQEGGFTVDRFLEEDSRTALPTTPRSYPMTAPRTVPTAAPPTVTEPYHRTDTPFEAKRCGIPEGQRNHTLSRFAAKILKRYGITERAYGIFSEEADRCEPPLEKEELEAIWRSACRFAGKVTQQEGYIPPEAYEVQAPSLRPSDFSDIGQAKVIAREYRDELRYTAATDYIRYDGQRWVESKQSAVGAVEEFLDRQLTDAKEAVQRAVQALEQVGVPKELLLSGNKSVAVHFNKQQTERYEEYVSAVAYKSFVMKRRNMKLVVSAMEAAKPMFDMSPTALDADGMLLNTPDGTYDLRRGTEGKRAHCAADYITKITAFAPSEEGKQEWLDALNLIFEKDKELIEYVQQIAGLCAIGNVYREEMIISYGGGSNGKSTFWNAIAGALGSYSGNISADTLTVGCNRNVKPELAEAKGKRLLIAAELEEGMRLNTSTVKQLCSTDEIFAEKKYKDPFSFKPSHTLVLYTNHLPKIGAMDDGVWRRLIVIPFRAKISGSSDIKNYSEFLLRKSGGYIVKWLMEGAKKAIEGGFNIPYPTIVQEAIHQYKQDNDWLLHFLDACCEVGTGLEAKSGDVYMAYRSYCAGTGEFTRSTTEFYKALELRGIRRKRNKSGKILCGITLLEKTEE